MGLFEGQKIVFLHVVLLGRPFFEPKKKFFSIGKTPQKQKLQPPKESTEDIDVQEKPTDKEEEEDDHDDDDDELEDDGNDDENTKNEELNEALAKKIYDAITKKILPQLNKSLTKKVTVLQHNKTTTSLIFMCLLMRKQRNLKMYYAVVVLQSKIFVLYCRLKVITS